MCSTDAGDVPGGASADSPPLIQFAGPGHSFNIAMGNCLMCITRERRKEVTEHLRISPSDLHVEKCIGYGSSSVVFSARWLCCEVAVKELLVNNFRNFNAYPKELEILMRLPHPHVVQLLGFCVEREPRRLFIVMERMETSLESVIRRRMRVVRRLDPFKVGEAFDVMTKIALGMKFLHSREIVHGGLSADIILMNVHAGTHFDVKIAGFAFSDYANRNSPTHSRHFKIEVTKADDIYTFALICFATLTGRKFHQLQNEAPTQEILQARASVLRPKFPPDIGHDLVELLLKCWDVNPEHRPGISVICDTLAEARDQILQKDSSTLRKVSDANLQWTTREDDEDNTCLEIATIMRKLPTHLSIDPADVEWRQPIGEGGYSKVYEVNWLGCTLAMKRFKSLSVSFIEEAEFLTKLQHPHVARLIGLTGDSNGGWIMTEQMDTDLQKLINSRKESRPSSPPFNDSEVWDLCLKVALGLNFLHAKNVVHRDIKPANVLVHDHGGRFDVKITDFGVSHRIGKPFVANRAGTGLWRAPEVLRGKALREHLLKKTDVYSFAMTCYGIVTGNDLQEHLSRQDVFEKRRPKLPTELHSDLVELICKCWDDDPKVRPDFATICHVLAKNPFKNHVRLEK